jgi:hypothetical protein
MSILSVFWALLPTLSIGTLTYFLAPLPFAHAVYGLASLTVYILWIIAINKNWSPAGGILYAVLLAVGLLATIHAFQLRHRVFTPRSLPTVAAPDSPHALAESDERIARGHRGDRA